MSRIVSFPYRIRAVGTAGGRVSWKREREYPVNARSSSRISTEGSRAAPHASQAHRGGETLDASPCLLKAESERP